MKLTEAIERIELALISLEYASADFLLEQSLSRGSETATRVETLQAKLTTANMALQLALQVLSGRDRAASVEPAFEGQQFA